MDNYFISEKNLKLNCYKWLKSTWKQNLINERVQARVRSFGVQSSRLTALTQARRFLLSFGKRTKLMPFDLADAFNWLLHLYTQQVHNIRSHCILCKQDSLSTRKYWCACARFRSAVTLKGPNVRTNRDLY